MFFRTRKRGTRIKLPASLEERLAEHRKRAGRYVDAVEDEYGGEENPITAVIVRDDGIEEEVMTDDPVHELAAGALLLEQDEETLLSALLVAVERCARTRQSSWTPPGRVAGALARKKLPYRREDVELLFRLALASRPAGWIWTEQLRIALAAAERHGDSGQFEPLLREALDSVSRDYMLGAERTKLRNRLLELLGDESVATDLFGDDNWGRRMRELTPPGLEPLLLHLARATSGPRPSKKWEREAAKLLDDLPGARDYVRTMLEEALAAEESEFRAEPLRPEDLPEDVRDMVEAASDFGDPDAEFDDDEPWTWLQWLNDASTVLVRGAVWAAAVSGESWAPDVIGRVAVHAAVSPGGARSVAVANAAARTLAELEPTAALPYLARLKAQVKDKGVLTQVDKALATAAERAGMAPGELLEIGVPAFGLDDRGTKTVEFGEHTAVVELAPPDKASITWRKDGKQLRSTPKAVREDHAEELAGLRAEVKELKKTLGAERARLEELLVEDREWAYDRWAQLYRGHPVTGALARNLIWVFGDRPGLPSDGAVLAANGKPFEPDEAGPVRLWHPLASTAADVRDWRRLLIEEERMQPFKQAFREIYLLTPVEEQTETYSNRFAAHVLRYPQTYALIRSRRWSGNALGPWDGGFEGVVKRDFPAFGIRAEFYLDLVETEDYASPLANVASTDQVRFYRLGAEAAGPMPLTDVPPIVFSEAMRDVDLFVSVTTIGADPEWQDRGTDRYLDYWRETAFSEELTGSAEVRREVLREIVPQLAIADRCEVTDRFLVVRGDFRTYKIHLGSANILMEPNDEYLCIVAARGTASRKASTVFLPFEDDARLSLILSKAFMLAEDAKIDDRAIVDQIKRG